MVGYKIQVEYQTGMVGYQTGMVGYQTGMVGYKTGMVGVLDRDGGGYQTRMVGYQIDGGIPDAGRVPDMG